LADEHIRVFHGAGSNSGEKEDDVHVAPKIKLAYGIKR
jgi:hypothetical protein